MNRYTVAVDFDGVLHAYTSPWINAHTIPDQPVVGAMSWLLSMIGRFEVVIFTTRAKTWRGRRAVRAWLHHHAGDGMWYETPNGRGIEDVTVTYKKPPALVYIDDRAWRFEGKFPTREEIHQARPWNKPDRDGIRGDRSPDGDGAVVLRVSEGESLVYDL